MVYVFRVTASLFDQICFGLLIIRVESSDFLLLLLRCFFLLVFHLLPFYFLPPVVSPLLTIAWLRRNRGRCSRSTQLPSTLPPTPPICTGSAVNPQKELTIQARTRIQRTPLHKSVLAQQLSPTKWATHTRTRAYPYAHAECCPNLLSVPDSSHRGVRSGVSIQGPGSLWAAGLANPDAGGHSLSN